MIDEEREKLRTVAWSELLPWLSLFRTFRLAWHPRALLFATVALVLTIHGWALFGWMFSGSDDKMVQQQIDQIAPRGDYPCAPLAALVPDRPTWPSQELFTNPTEWLQSISVVWQTLSQPFVGLFHSETSLTGLAYLLLCGLWAVLVWAFFGGAITRSAALQLAADEQIGTRELVGFVWSRWRSYAAAALFPFLGVLVANLGILFVSWLLCWSVSAWVVAILWPLLLLGGLMMTVLLLGAWFGWPLMWATISSEGTDSFDALNRMYAYVREKPLQYLFYIVVAGLFGTLGWLLVVNFAAAILAFTDWAASWGCGQESYNDLLACKTTAGYLIQFWRDCVKLLAVGFLFSYFWTAATAIYFLLRRDVDATEMDEVFTDDEQSNEVYGLPNIGTDEQDAPTITEPETPTPPEETDQPE
ncbi:MAG: hypothetical protein JW888_03975 [Pirellulales bacterium]|nr:hypothetical protein [Pirellulales bacterium]